MRRRLGLAVLLASLFLIGSVAPAQAKVADPPSPQGVTSIGTGYGSCPKNTFCAWSQTGAGGYGVAYPELRTCGTLINFTDAYNDWIDSIKNNMSVPVEVLNYEGGGYWRVIWYSSPGNWGNLPWNVRNMADGLLADC